jgi:hypothetical protein
MHARPDYVCGAVLMDRIGIRHWTILEALALRECRSTTI